jgi:predicted alpha/beta superfamily hydrolase
MNSFRTIKLNLLLFSLTFSLFMFISLKAQTEDHLVEYCKIHHIRSEILKEDRTITVSLPASYQNSVDYYPLLIVLDGEDFFHPIAGMISYYSKIGKCPELIVIGLDTKDRWRDYTPTHAQIPDGTPVPTSGGSELFYKFIKMELIKLLESKYRISPFHLIYGHSIAGLFVINTVFEEQPDFSGFIATSPSLWWDNELITTKALASARLNFSHNRYLFFTIGNEGPTMLDPILNFEKSLNDINKPEIIWKFEKYDNIDHQTMPIKAFIYGLEFIFSDWQMPQNFYDEGLNAVVEYYDKLSQKYMAKINPPETTINLLGYMALNKGKLSEALRIFQYNINLYPYSGNVYDSMGEAYLQFGDSTQALKNYKKSLELNPNNDNAKKIIQKLESN